MAKLSVREMIDLEELFEMESGYVLDFASNTKFRRFVVKAVDIDAYDPKYGEENSGSKANRLRAIWDIESDDTVGRLIDALIDHRGHRPEFSRSADPDDMTDYEGPDPKARLIQDCRAIARRLMGGGTEIHAATPTPTEEAPMTTPGTQTPLRRNVFVVHGHDQAAVDDLFSFLSGIGLTPVSWDHAKGLARPGLKTNADVVRAAIEGGDAIVVLFTPDEIARRAPHLGGDPEERYQPRPNVLLETGWAIGEHSEKTVIVEARMVNRVSDIDGVQCIRMSDHTSLAALAEELRHIGCDVDTRNSRYSVVDRFPGLFTPKPSLDPGRSELPPEKASFDDETLVEMLKRGLPGTGGLLLHTEFDARANVPEGTSKRLGQRAATEAGRLEKATAGGLTLTTPQRILSL